MNEPTDAQLLGAWAETRSEAAFAEVVRRHVDFVYSAALRLVCDSHLAQDVTQSVFIALADNAPRVVRHPALCGWLHRTTQNLAAQTVRANVRRSLREQEAAAMNASLSPEPDVPWERIAPHLDAALGELTEPDRDAVLLRYFENKSLREVGQVLGTSEDTAQKRVSRAVERLRKCLAGRGITVGASSLAAALAVNSIQAAPAGLAASATNAAASVGTNLAAAATASKLLVMTTLQKSLLAVLIVGGTVTPFLWQHREAVRLRKEVVALRQEKAALLARPPAGSVEKLQAAASPAAAGAERPAPAELGPAEVVARIAALLAERKPMDTARMEAWARLMAQIPAARMGEAVEAALKLPEPELRTGIANTLLHNWQQTNPRATLAFATVKLQGREKATVMRDALQRWAAEDPQGAFEAWREQASDPTQRLAWGGDHQEMVQALFAGMAKQDFQKAVGFVAGLEEDLVKSAWEGIGKTAANSAQGREFFLEQLKRGNESFASIEILSSFISAWSREDLPSAMKWVEGQPAGKARDSALRAVGWTYARRDPKAAAAWWLAQAATPAQRSAAIFAVTQEWAGHDAKAAGEWLNQQSFTNEELDGGRSAFAEAAVWQDAATALKWAESITQASLRNPVVLRTWRKWHESNAGAAEQYLAQCHWPAELVAEARGETAGR